MAAIKKFCEPCLSENLKVRASVHCYDCREHLCDACGKIHKKFKTSRDHKIGDLINVPYVIAEQFLNSLAACAEHEWEAALWYCDDHRVLCCKECATTVHKPCKTLDTDTAVISIKSKDQTLNWPRFKGTILHFEKQALELTDHESCQATEIGELELTITKELECIKKALDDAYEQLESNVKRDFNDGKERLLKSISTQNESAVKLKEEVSQIKKKIEMVDGNGQEIHKVLLERSIKGETTEHIEKKVSFLYDNVTTKGIMWSMVKPRCDIVKDILNLIQVAIIDKNIKLLLKPPALKVPKLLATINLRESGYKDWFYPEGCVWVREFIVVSISGQNVVKLVDSVAKSVVDTHACISEPLALTIMDKALVAVWLPKDDQIDVLGIEDGKLKHIRSISTSNKIRDIQYNPDTENIIALCREEGTIRFLDNEGESTGIVPLDKTVTETVEDSLRFRLGQDNKTLYISGYCMHRLLAVGLDGDIFFEYTHDNLIYPVGCDFDADGNIFVVSWKGHTIHELSKDGEHKRELLEGDLYYPQSICFNEAKDQFAVIHTLAESHLNIYSFTE